MGLITETNQLDINQNEAYIAYCLPGQSKIVARQCSYERIAFDEVSQVKCDFIFAPFDKSAHETLAFQFHTNWAMDNLKHIQLPEYSSAQLTKSDYLQKVNELIGIIKNSSLDKIVLSRTEFHMQGHFEIRNFIEDQVKMYPDAFNYMVYIPNELLWIGSTPELLLDTVDAQYHTVALAGTQSVEVNQQDGWGNKERDEHRFIESFLRNELAERATGFNITPSYTSHAGRMCHIKSDIYFDMGMPLTSILNVIHPGPAISGFPKEKAMHTISEVEGYDRSYYTGFLGLMSEEATLNLFINLRCMQVFNNGSLLYLGGGITADSDPEAEWEETVLKSSTMLRAMVKARNEVEL